MLKGELERVKTLIHRRGEQVFRQKRLDAAGMGTFIQDFVSQLEQSAQGGKAVRAGLVCYGALACGGQEKPALLDLALAMELFHSYLLMHDDIIDQDDLRRGKPSFHAYYRDLKHDEYQPHNPQHFGHAMAILGGDILSSIGYELICQADLPANTRLSVISQVNKMLFETGAGEILDVLNDLVDDATRAHLLKVHLLKTSCYSFSSPLLIGAYASGASERQRSLLESYALPVGIAYQLHDDLLGMFGDETEIGKPLYSDLRQGKQTLLIIEARRRATFAQRAVLDRVVGKLDLGAAEAEQVKDIVKQTGAHQYSVELANHFKDLALGSLDETLLQPKGVQFLQELAEYIVRRPY